MKIRTKTKERLLSEGWYYYDNKLRKDGVDPVINETMQKTLLGEVLDVEPRPNHYVDTHGWVWTPEMIETKEEQVLRILKEYESRRQGGN